MPCDFTLVDFGGIFEYWYSYYEHSYEFKIPRSKGNIHVEREKKCRRALEWVGVFKGPAGFEIRNIRLVVLQVTKASGGLGTRLM